MATVLSVRDISSCRTGVACSFGGLLVVGPSISPCGWVCSLCFHPWGGFGVFSWVMGCRAFALWGHE